MTKLDTYLTDIDQSGYAFSKEIGVDPSLVSKWRRGLVRPSYDRMVVIERATDGRVPVSAWAANTPSGKASTVNNG